MIPLRWNTGPSAEGPVQVPKRPQGNFGKRGPLTWKTFFGTAGIGGALLAFMLYVRNEKELGKVPSIVFISFLLKSILHNSLGEGAEEGTRQGGTRGHF